MRKNTSVTEKYEFIHLIKPLSLSTDLCEAQFDASLFESAGELFQLLQVTGLLGVGGHRGHRGPASSTAAHIQALISLQQVRGTGVKVRMRQKQSERNKG